MRVLLIKRDKLGDLLLTTPLLAHVRATRPDIELHLLANDYNAWVVRDHPALAKLWVYPRVRHRGRVRIGAAIAQVPLWLALRRQHFAAAIAMGGDESHRAIKRAIATGAAEVIAYAADAAAYGRRLTHPLPVPQTGHEVDRMAALLAPLGIAPPAQWAAPTYVPAESAQRFAFAWLSERGLAWQRYAVIGIGARRAKKQPGTDQLERWARWLEREHALRTVFMWTPGAREAPGYPGDDDIAAPLLARGLPFVSPFRGPVAEALGLIHGARTSIFPDSGLMHFAAASPGGVLGLFADPADSAPASRWAPLGPRARYLEAERSVRELEDEQVFAEVEMLLYGR
ncbi:MAG TPA: glycosyltransferase family 9 protein [Casimicrobiaceae bacterium]|nr:glycosyltransferase family 9 protein [Casimicrobiaceae bacterium]